MKSKYHTGNTILLIAVLVLALIGLPISISMSGKMIEDASWEKKYSSKHVDSYEPLDGAYAAYIGDKYAGVAEDGYGYVRVYFPLLNNGTEEVEDLNINLEDGDDYEVYSNVYHAYDTTDGDFVYDVEDTVFPGQMGYVSEVYKVKNTVNQLRFTVYKTYEDYRAKTDGTPYQVSIQR